MGDLNRNIWEGWTPRDFIDSIQSSLDMVMSGNSWRKPFENKEDLCRYIAEEQPYYKEKILEVEEYFISRYKL
ncbi:MAG: hypothetical protein R3Y12_04190 [Clostridia bacterium]